MENEVYFVKSFEEDFCTKTLKGKKKVSCQTAHQIVSDQELKPNTISFNRERRLSTTIIHENYPKTYRPQGIIFQTEAKPDYIIPFDLVLVSDVEKVVVHYYRIKNNLHMYYNHNLIPGFEKFIFTDFNTLIKRYPSPKKAWKEVNKFRIAHGYRALPKEKYRLVLYNEAVFNKPIKIRPIALFGYNKIARLYAKQCGLKWFRSAKEFNQKYNPSLRALLHKPSYHQSS